MKMTIKNICILLVVALYATAVQAKKSDGNNYTAGKSLAFVENKGQIVNQHKQQRGDIDFKLAANGVTLFVGAGQLHYQWTKTSPNPSEGGELLSRSSNNNTSRSFDEEPREVSIYRMDVRLVGANKNAKLITNETSNYTENYYLPQCIDGTTAKSYQRITYVDVYPNIDWVLYVKDGEVKHDFVVHAGGDVADIQLEYAGATELSLSNGALTATTPYGSITEAAPYTYDASTGATIASRYRLQGSRLSYAIDAYEATNSIVIDPALRWGTYFGDAGSKGEFMTAAVTDTSANVIICGTVNGNSNIVTTGAHQTTYADSMDGFVAKFDSTGSLLWCTFYGGHRLDAIIDIATDQSNNIFFAGYTLSDTGMATIGSYKSSFDNNSVNFNYHALIVKLDSNGVRQWATYYGDTAGARAFSIDCDVMGNIYFGGEESRGAGMTSNANFATTGAFQTVPSSSHLYYTERKGYLAKFSNTGSRIWSTYYNGVVLDIECRDTNVYLYGTTGDTANMATTGAYQTSCTYCGTNNGAGYDGFLARFTSSGNRLWGSYYNDRNIFDNITTDPAGNLYIAGTTISSTGIATTGTHQTTYAGLGDGYIMKFSAAGTKLWGTYFGGANNDLIAKIMTNEKGDIYVTGYTKSTSNIATATAYQTALAGTNKEDLFLAVFNANGIRKYATYYGGTNKDVTAGGVAHAFSYESGRGILAYSKGKIYFGGQTTSSSGIATTGAHQTTLQGSTDMCLIQFDADTSVYIKQPYTDTVFCVGDTLHLEYGVLQNFRSTNSFTVQLSNSSGSFASATTIGSSSANIGGTIACAIPAVAAGNGYRVRIIGSAPADTSYDNLQDIRITPYPANFVASTNSPICTGDSILLNSATTTSGVTYSWTGPNSFTATTGNTHIVPAALTHTGTYYVAIDNDGCIVRDTFSVVVNQTPQNVIANNNTPICTGDTLKLFSASTTSGVTYSWTGATNYNTQNVLKANAQLVDTGLYIVTATLNGCSDTAQTRAVIGVSATVTVVPTPGSDICAGSTLQLTGYLQNAGTNPSLQWKKNGTNISGAINITYSTATISTGNQFSLEVTPVTTCNSTRTSNVVTMNVLQVKTPSVSITANPNTSLDPNEPVTFTATPVNGGNNPTYQWTRNGAKINGATNATWGANANALNVNDDICVIMYSDYVCPSPDSAISNCIKVKINVGVNNITNDKVFSLFPNPNNGSFILDGNVVMKEDIRLSIINSIGQVVHQQTIKGRNGKLNERINTSSLANGVYLLQLQSGDYKLHKRFTVQ